MTDEDLGNPIARWDAAKEMNDLLNNKHEHYVLVSKNEANKMTNEQRQAALDAVKEWINLCVSYPCEAPVNVHLDVVTSLDTLEYICSALSSPPLPADRQAALDAWRSFDRSGDITGLRECSHQIEAALSAPHEVLDVDTLAQIIRTVDGENRLGASDLASRILECMKRMEIRK